MSSSPLLTILSCSFMLSTFHRHFLSQKKCNSILPPATFLELLCLFFCVLCGTIMGAWTVLSQSLIWFLTSTKSCEFLLSLATGRRSHELTLDGWNRREDKFCVLRHGMPSVLYWKDWRSADTCHVGRLQRPETILYCTPSSRVKMSCMSNDISITSLSSLYLKFISNCMCDTTSHFKRKSVISVWVTPLLCVRLCVHARACVHAWVCVNVCAGVSQCDSVLVYRCSMSNIWI